ncbi:aconitate hydratase AcnA [Marinospirillum insulare]|uniref:Aconitate hydratase n=1 Tax=Marinospirillum insulare TaxID=217169 RepID=A0ABQ5ZWH8_9GAMM|nr:aconitate hydratase AcnA [Marinospirillum insulare]GLR64354.1 aconitate hydratase [Marinospirillum insulare]
MNLNAKSFLSLDVGQQSYGYFSLAEAAKTYGKLDHLPISIKILLENLLRFEDGKTITPEDIQNIVDGKKQEIAFRPARVLMQDFTGVPGVVDLAAMRAAVAELGDNPEKINPLTPVDLVIDHSVMVDEYASEAAFQKNVDIEMQRNGERYTFLRWGQQAFNNFSVVPPGTGICHQVNLEYLAQSVWSQEVDGKTVIYPDTLVGTDSHTTMINGLGVLGWGVGGIEAEAAMLGQPISMLLPDVVGFKLLGSLPEGITATDLVLTVTQMLRQHGVVGKFVEFYGPGLAELPLADRATLANMAPEYGATCGFFPVDQVTLDYLKLTGRDPAVIARVESYCKIQGLWHNPDVEPNFSSSLQLDLSSVEPSLAGPKRPQDRVPLSQVKNTFQQLLSEQIAVSDADQDLQAEGGAQAATGSELEEGAVVIAAITSCTNTSNPSVMLAAGLVAKKAVELGIQVQPWVKTSLAPGSKVVTNYLAAAGLDTYLDQLGFNLVGYGCTTCIGNSGPLDPKIEKALVEQQLTVASVLSGNRNFEGRIHPLVKTNWLASPPLVVAYALAGNISLDISQEPLGYNPEGKAVYLKDVWPSNAEIAQATSHVTSQMFQKEYAAVFDGDASWQNIQIPQDKTYTWPESSYIKHPPFFTGLTREPAPIKDIDNAALLAILGDSVTTDHISPAGGIKPSSPAGRYLQELGIDIADFNSYGSRRGNHEVMMRGTFANVRIKNEMLDGIEGGETRHYPSGEQLAIYDAAMRYLEEDRPLVVVAGKEYGTGSSRDWAAKGTLLLGVRAVIAESYERIHRSNLMGMGVLPLEFVEGQNRQTLKLDGTESFSISGLNQLEAGQLISLTLTRNNGTVETLNARCRIDTSNELDYYRHGGILHYVLRKLINQ